MRPHLRTYTRFDSLQIPLFLASMHFAFHAFTNNTYGIFRDELYYLACADHLDWGYVDHPMLSILLLKLTRVFLGDGVKAIRLLPAFGGALFILLTSIITCELGGRRFAQGLAALCACIAPVYLVLFGFYSMNAFDLLCWAVALYLILRLLNTGNQRLWLWLGVVFGVGLMNKLSVLFLGVALTVSLLATPHRIVFRQKAPWIGALLAFLIASPYVLWQVFHEWATLEFMQNAKQYKIAAFTPLEFLAGQILELHPFTFPIWLFGLGLLLWAKSLRRYRLLGLIYVLLLLFFIVQRSKVYYLVPAYPILFAAGALGIERLLLPRIPWSRVVIVGMLVIGGCMTLPFGIPILPPDVFAAYQERLGLRAPIEEHTHEAELPQHFADRFGWKNMAHTVGVAVRSLSLEQQQECVILASNYGEASAMKYYQFYYDLPPVISGHNNYYLWGYGDATGNVVISIGFSENDLQAVFTSVRPIAVIHSPYAMPYETNLPVYLCQGLKLPIEEAWPVLKRYV